MKEIIKYIFVCILVSVFMPVYAQIGVITTQPQATLHVTPSSTNSNNAEGIIAPNLSRSELIDKDNVYTSAQTGALVYVTNVDGVVTTKTAKITSIGYYFFDGSLWQRVDNNQGQYFYLPTFTLPITTVGTGFTFDIYNDVYKKQFNKAANPQFTPSDAALVQIFEGRYNATELDYVVTYYDESIMKINSISPAGIINYNVLDTRLGPSSFINIVVVAK